MFVHSYEPDKILTQEEYDELTGVVYNRIKGQLEGPMFFMEEYEDEGIPVEGENIEEAVPRIVRQRKVDKYRLYLLLPQLSFL